MVQRRKKGSGGSGFWERLGAGLQGGVSAYLPAWQAQQQQQQWQAGHERQARRDAMQDITTAGGRIKDRWGTLEDAQREASVIAQQHPAIDPSFFEQGLRPFVPTEQERVTQVIETMGENFPDASGPNIIEQAGRYGIPSDRFTGLVPKSPEAFERPLAAGTQFGIGRSSATLPDAHRDPLLDPPLDTATDPAELARQQREMADFFNVDSFASPLAKRIEGLQAGDRDTIEARLRGEAEIEQDIEEKATRRKAETALSINEDQFTRVMQLEIDRAKKMAPVEREIAWQQNQDKLDQEWAHRQGTWQEYLDQQTELAVMQVVVTDEPQFRTYMDPDTGETTTYSLTRDWSPENYGNLRWTDITEQMKGQVEWSPYLHESMRRGEGRILGLLSQANRGGGSTDPDTAEGRANLEATAEAQNLSPEEKEAFFDAARQAHEGFGGDQRSATDRMIEDVYGKEGPPVLANELIGEDPDAYAPNYTASYRDATGRLLFKNPDYDRFDDTGIVQEFLTSDQVQARDLRQIQTNREQINREIEGITEQIGNIKAQQDLPSAVRNAEIALREEQLAVMNKLAQDSAARQTAFDAYWGNQPELPPRTSDIHLSTPDPVPGLPEIPDYMTNQRRPAWFNRHSELAQQEPEPLPADIYRGRIASGPVPWGTPPVRLERHLDSSEGTERIPGRPLPWPTPPNQFESPTGPMESASRGRMLPNLLESLPDQTGARRPLESVVHQGRIPERPVPWPTPPNRFEPLLDRLPSRPHHAPTGRQMLEGPYSVPPQAPSGQPLVRGAFERPLDVNNAPLGIPTVETGSSFHVPGVEVEGQAQPDMYRSVVDRVFGGHSVPLDDRTQDALVALLKGMVQVESSGNPRAQEPNTGARGAAQFREGTAEEYVPGGYEGAWDLEASIEGMARYLLDLMGSPTPHATSYGPEYNITDVDSLLQGYNRGPGKTRGGSALPQETRNYIPKVRELVGPELVRILNQYMQKVVSPSQVDRAPISVGQ
jgi:hypothetical protein